MNASQSLAANRQEFAAMEQKMPFTLLDDGCLIDPAPDQECLYIQSDGAVFCLAPWRADLACSRYENQGWRAAPDQPDWHFGDLASLSRHSPRVERFIAQVPLELRRLAGQFTWMQIPALRLLRLTSYAAQLARDAPFLFWLMAIAFQMGRLTARECLTLFGMRHKKILAEVLGEDPGNKHFAMGTLKKLTVLRYESNEYAMFVALYKSGLFKVARHAQSICLSLLQEKFIEPKLLYIESELLCRFPFDQWAQAHALYKECLRLADVSEYKTVQQLCMACRDLKDLRRLHDALADAWEYTQNFVALEDAQPFPPEPFPGSDSIEPVKTAHELYIEGVEMEHCVYTMIDSIYMGQCYIYRVLVPQRGTLCVSAVGSQPAIWEFLLQRNEPPSAESNRHVEQWLSRAVADRAGMLMGADDDSL